MTKHQARLTLASARRHEQAATQATREVERRHHLNQAQIERDTLARNGWRPVFLFGQETDVEAER